MTAKDISTALFSLLTGAGLAPEEIDRLLARIEQYPDKWPFIMPLDLVRPSQTLTRLATVVAADRDAVFTSLQFLLQYLNDRLDELDDYHLGIFWHLMGYLHWKMQGRRYPAIRYLNRSVDRLVRSLTPEAGSYLSRVYDTKGQIAYSDGYFQEAIEDFQDALRINQQDGNAYSEALTYGNLGRLHMEMGNFERAYEYLLKDLDIVTNEFPDLTRVRAQLLSHCGACLLELGRMEESRDCYQQSLDLARDDENTIGEIYALIGLGKVALVHPEGERPAVCCADARSLIEEKGVKGTLGELPGMLQHLDARIHHANGDLERAAQAFEQGYELIRKSRHVSRIQKARFLIDYAALTRERGDSNRTVSLLQEALSALDSTSAEQLRKETQEALKKEQPQAWLYHSIRRFTGQGQIESLFEEAGQTGFSGERHEVAILFTDIRNFTGISERFDPQELILLLNDFLSRMIRSVAHFSGHIDKILGDSMMAIFSLPQPRANDAERALLTALMMQEELKLFNARRPKGLPPLTTGTGIHFGEVVAGLVGSPLKRSYTVIGDTVNTASRLEGMTKVLGGAILVSETFCHRIAHPERYLFRPLGKFPIRGRQESIRVVEVAGENDRSPEAIRIKREIEEAEQALDWFSHRRFDRAQDGFRKLFEQTRLPAYQLLERSALQFLEEPPPEGWRGEVS